jgi:hypothetical protein
MRRVLSVLFLLLGLGLLAGAGFAAWREVEFRRGAIETDGLVVEMLAGSSRDRTGRHSRTYRPVFVFALPDGTKRRVEGGVASNPPCCTVGETVRVRYRPEAPEQAQMVGFMESWFVVTLLGGIGAVFTLVGFAVKGVGRRAGPGLAPVAAPARAVTMAVPLAGLRREAMPGGTAWILQARWTDPRTGWQRLFESPPIPFDPVPQMRRMTSVNVAFDPANPNGAYAMDLSFLAAPGPQTPVGPVRRG